MESKENTPTATPDTTPPREESGQVEEPTRSDPGLPSDGGPRWNVSTTERVKATVNTAVKWAAPPVTGAGAKINATNKKALEQASPYRRQITVILAGSAALLLLVVIRRRRGLVSSS